MKIYNGTPPVRPANEDGGVDNDLILRYLHAIGRHLAPSRRDDILAELSADLMAEVEDREATLGRAMTSAEQNEWLKGHGRPFIVAARYGEQQYLIGPMVFPYYFLILKVALTLSAFLYLLAHAIQIGVTGATAKGAIGVIAGLPFSLLVTAGWVTLVFVILEIAASRYPGMSALRSEWKPESLPPVVADSPSRLKSITGAVVHLSGIFWLAAAPFHPYLVLGPGAGYFSDGPVRATAALHAVYWPIVALLFVPWIVRVAILGRSLTARQRMFVRAFNGAISVLIFGVAMRVHDYFTVVGTTADEAKYRYVVDVYGRITSLSLRVGFAVCLFLLVWDVAKFLFKAQGGLAPVLRGRAHH